MPSVQRLLAESPSPACSPGVPSAPPWPRTCCAGAHTRTSSRSIPIPMAIPSRSPCSTTSMRGWSATTTSSRSSPRSRPRGRSRRRRYGASSCARASSSTTARPSPPRTCSPRSSASVDPASPLKGNLPAYKSAKKVDDHTIDIEVTDTYPLLLNDLTNIYIFDKQWLVENNAYKPTDAGKGVEGYADQQCERHRPVPGSTGRKPDAADGVREESELVGQAAPQSRRGSSSRRSPRRRRASRRCSRARSTSPSARRCRTCRASRPARTSRSCRPTSCAPLLRLQHGRQAAPSRDVTGKNPFKDKRVREALYRAIDIDALQRQVMRGLSRNTGSLVAPAISGICADAGQAAALRSPTRPRRCSPTPATRMGSRSRSLHQRRLTSTRSRSARRRPRCGRASG